MECQDFPVSWRIMVPCLSHESILQIEQGDRSFVGRVPYTPLDFATDLLSAIGPVLFITSKCFPIIQGLVGFLICSMYLSHTKAPGFDAITELVKTE